ncbi:MAG: Gfo/Idh/MocA family oxidoreductase, partial [Kiritimatiellia bacterium]
WRRFTALSGGSLLEKSCHDLDLLTWMADSRPTRVSSFGGKAIFCPNSFLPDKCDEKCPISDRCIYYLGNKRMSNNIGSVKMDDCCIYNSLKDIADHQSVQIQYENGVVCNFLLNFNTSNDHSGKKKVMSHNLENDEITEHHLTLNNSPHAGGNRLHAEEFLRLAAGIAKKPKASEYDAFVSAMLCFAADRSRAEKRQVGFQYPGFKNIELV